MRNIRKYNLYVNEALKNWDDALPLGNGLLGALIWGDGEPLNISLDRVDIWDTRENIMINKDDFDFYELKKLVEEGKQEDILRRFDDIYNEVTPTKIPAGRLELRFSEKSLEVHNSLSIEDAIAEVKFKFESEEVEIKTFLHARDRYGFIKIVGNKAVDIIERPHDFTKSSISEVNKDSLKTSDVSALDYAPVKWMLIDGIRVIKQETNEELTFALIVGSKEYEGGKDVVYYISSSNDGENWLELGVDKVKEALSKGYYSAVESHRKWWKDYWNKSSITIPNEKLEKLWYLNTYLFASTSREGSLPMALQGVWTADEGKLPPWKGDYHNDLNTQFSYLHYLKSNRLEEGKSFIDFLWNLVPSARNHANKFFKSEGIAFPGVMDVKGRPLGGWPQYSLSITNSCWLCEMFHEYWLYSGDDEFLREKCYTFLKDTAKVVKSMLIKDEKGYLNLELSTSSEIHDNTLKAWLKPTSNYDLSIIFYLFKALKEESEYLGYIGEKEMWENILKELNPLHIKDGMLMVNEVEKLEESHRHHSHCMSIYPLDLLKYEDDNDKIIMKKTISDLERLGTSAWVGYSFVWMAALYTRVKNGEKAEKQLEIFNDCTSSINGFHVNGDYKDKGVSNHKYKIFTLEGNMAAIAAVQEMLLQTYDNTIRIFEAMPKEWSSKEVSFKNLRGEGGILISSSIKENKIDFLEVTCTRDWEFKVKNPFNKNKVKIVFNDEELIINEGIIKINGVKGTKYKFYISE